VGQDLVEHTQARADEPLGRRPILSVVIPTYNGRRLLETCLASVARHRPGGRAVEIIVSDDGSRDDSVTWLEANHPDVQVVRRKQNGGFCAAANAGIAAARGEFVQLLNNDTEVTEGWVEAGLEPFADPRVGSVAPLVLVRSDPKRVDSAGDRYAIFGWPSKRGHGQPAELWADRPSGPVFGASGSSAFYRASALQRVGTFDPAFGSYYEDVDLAFRLRWAGYTCIYAPRCQILHEISASYDHGRSDLQRRMARNAEILFWTSLPAGLLAIAVLPHAAFTFAQAAWRLPRGRGRPFLEGKLEALRQVPTLRAGRKVRTELAADAVARPHFPVTFAPLGDMRNHLRRPREASAQT
jgi:GT2 family glycosyltransferase